MYRNINLKLFNINTMKLLFKFYNFFKRWLIICKYIFLQTGDFINSLTTLFID